MRTKVLVVDDSHVSRTLVSVTLESAGFSTVAVGSGAEALRLLQTKTPPFLLVLDLNMPTINGFDVLRWLRQAGLSPFPVLVISGSDDPLLVRAAIELGATSYIAKPFTPQLLQTAARWVTRSGMPRDRVA